jgi:hypothetical protein
MSNRTALYLVIALATLGVIAMVRLTTLSLVHAAPVAAPAAGEFTDACEPNDVSTQSKPLGCWGAQGVYTLTFMSTSGFYTDTDWYVYSSLQTNQVLTLTATRFGTGANIFVDGFFENGTGTGTRLSNGSVSTLVITNTTGTTQNYLFKVWNAAPFYDLYKIDYTVINLPVATPSPTPSISCLPNPSAGWDGCDEAAIPNNDSPVTSTLIIVGNSINNLNFYPKGQTANPFFWDVNNQDVDWFYFYANSGSTYRLTTVTANNSGVNTYIYLYDTTMNLVAQNDAFQVLNNGSQLVYVVPTNAGGIYRLKVVNTDQTPRFQNQGYYNIAAEEIVVATSTPGPSPTITPLGPTSTPYPGTTDRFEYNGDYDHASLIAPNVKYDNLNFVPWQPPAQTTFDNDFYRLPVKQGIYYTCQTLDLAAGVDTNIIIYNGDKVGIGGNDDVSTSERANGNFASRFSWLASYTGNAFILAGEVNPPLANEAGAHTYSLRCDIGLPVTATPTATVSINPSATFVPASPEPPEPTMTPYPTPRSAQNLPVRQINGAATTPTPQPTAAIRTMEVNVQIFNDANKNGLLDPGEGISNASVRLADEQAGTPLAQSFTDADGRVNFSVPAPGPVRLSVPLFGYSVLLNEPAATVRIAVMAAVALPTRIP